MKRKVLVIHHQLGPYHIVRLNVLAKMQYDLTAVELTSKVGFRDWTVDEDMHFKRITLTDERYEDIDHKSLAEPLRKVLDQVDPDCIVVAGYAHPAMRAAAVWAKENGRKTILFSESQTCDARRRLPIEWFKGAWLRKYFTHVFASGARAAAYMESLGFPADRIWRGYSVVETSHFAEQAELARGMEDEVREKYRLPEKYFLYVGRFSQEKNLERFLRAYDIYRKGAVSQPWDLMLLGSGPQEAELKSLADELNISGVYWGGFRQVDELPAFYSFASAFILPSAREPWGLVVNEAMATGLPVLVSQNCGCTLDLVFPGRNGWVINPFDENDMAVAMARMSSSDELQRMGEASRAIVKNFTPQTWSLMLADCIAVVLEQS